MERVLHKNLQFQKWTTENCWNFRDILIESLESIVLSAASVFNILRVHGSLCKWKSLGYLKKYNELNEEKERKKERKKEERSA